MKRIGDAAAGFSVVFDPNAGAVQVRGWGFWSATISSSFAASVAEICNASPRGSALAIDMTELKPLRDEGQEAFGTLMRLLRGLGVGKTTVATTSQLTKLQLLRLVAEHGMKNSVQFTNASSEKGLVTDQPQGDRTNR
jgi:hypothetical protein